MNSREVLGSPVVQGQNERIPYGIDFAPCGIATPTNIICTVYDKTLNYVDVTSTVLTGTASAAGSVVTMPVLFALVPGHEYWLMCRATGSALTEEPYLRVIAER